METYFDIYHDAIIKKNFYVNILSSSSNEQIYFIDTGVPIYY